MPYEPKEMIDVKNLIHQLYVSDATMARNGEVPTGKYQGKYGAIINVADETLRDPDGRPFCGSPDDLKKVWESERKEKANKSILEREEKLQKMRQESLANKQTIFNKCIAFIEEKKSVIDQPQSSLGAQPIESSLSDKLISDIKQHRDNGCFLDALSLGKICEEFDKFRNIFIKKSPNSKAIDAIFKKFLTVIGVFEKNLLERNETDNKAFHERIRQNAEFAPDRWPDENVRKAYMIYLHRMNQFRSSCYHSLLPPSSTTFYTSKKFTSISSKTLDSLNIHTEHFSDIYIDKDKGTQFVMDRYNNLIPRFARRAINATEAFAIQFLLDPEKSFNAFAFYTSPSNRKDLKIKFDEFRKDYVTKPDNSDQQFLLQLIRVFPGDLHKMVSKNTWGDAVSYQLERGGGTVHYLFSATNRKRIILGNRGISFESGMFYAGTIIIDLAMLPQASYAAVYSKKCVDDRDAIPPDENDRSKRNTSYPSAIKNKEIHFAYYTLGSIVDATGPSHQKDALNQNAIHDHETQVAANVTYTGEMLRLAHFKRRESLSDTVIRETLSMITTITRIREPGQNEISLLGKKEKLQPLTVMIKPTNEYGTYDSWIINGVKGEFQTRHIPESLNAFFSPVIDGLLPPSFQTEQLPSSSSLSSGTASSSISPFTSAISIASAPINAAKPVSSIPSGATPSADSSLSSGTASSSISTSSSTISIALTSPDGSASIAPSNSAFFNKKSIEAEMRILTPFRILPSLIAAATQTSSIIPLSPAEKPSVAPATFISATPSQSPSEPEYKQGADGYRDYGSSTPRRIDN